MADGGSTDYGGLGNLLAGGASLFGGLFGSAPASGVQLPPSFYMPNMGGAAQGAYQGIQGIPGANTGQFTLPLAQQTAQQQYFNPYAGGFQQGANTGAGMGQGAAVGNFGAGQMVQGAGLGLLPYGGSVLQTAFDPQNALYQRTLGQVTDAANASASNAGVATSPYGQGTVGNTIANFNIDWQNNQLGRQLQGLQGAGGAFTTGGQVAGAGGAMSTGAANDFATFGAMPYNAYGQIGQGQFGALSNLQGVAGGAQSLANDPIQQYLAYLGVGNQAGSVANQGAQVGINQAAEQFKENQALGGGVGSGLAQIGRGFGQLPFPSMPNFGSEMML